MTYFNFKCKNNEFIYLFCIISVSMLHEYLSINQFFIATKPFHYDITASDHKTLELKGVGCQEMFILLEQKDLLWPNLTGGLAFICLEFQYFVVFGLMCIFIKCQGLSTYFKHEKWLGILPMHYFHKQFCTEVHMMYINYFQIKFQFS